MLKVAALGDRESVSGFKAIGMDVFSPSAKDRVRELLNQLCNEDYAVIYITEEYAALCYDIIDKYSDFIQPSIILVPGFKNNTGEGMKRVNMSIEKAVGSQLPD